MTKKLPPVPEEAFEELTADIRARLLAYLKEEQPYGLIASDPDVAVIPPPGIDTDYSNRAGVFTGSPGTRAKKRVWLEEFAKTGNGSAAAKAVGISKATIWHVWLKVDPLFKAAYEEAWSASIDVLDLAAWRLAVQGTKEVKQIRNQTGQIIATETRTVYYPQLLIYLLRVRDPEKHNEKKVIELTGKDGGPVTVAGIIQRFKEQQALAEAKKESVE
ncbi:MAG: hypothetical protein KGL39_48070 [Patescibacteria group bacterium]|nr:hypothetical protein [Patescibacteria group bacterium]